MKTILISILVAACVCLLLFSTASGDVITDFETGTLEGWTEHGTFNGELSAVQAGNPGYCTRTRDSVAGGGTLRIEAPLSYTGDLSSFTGIRWDEWIPNSDRPGAFETLNTGVRLVAVDGTTYDSIRPPRGPFRTWIARYTPFEESHWELSSAGSSSFSQVVQNVQSLQIQVEVSQNTASKEEARVDNVILVGSPDPADPPLIVEQPVDAIDTVGGSASFFVTATGTEPLDYQWQFESANLLGENNPELLLSNVLTNQAGDYLVIVSNAFGAVTSDVASLTVLYESYTLNLVEGFNFIANQLDHGGNTLDEVMPDVPEGSRLFKWNNSVQGWEQAVHLSNTWFDLSSFFPLSPLTLSPGEGAFLDCPSPTSLVFEGLSRVPEFPVVLGGWNMLSRQEPKVASYTDIVGEPATPFTAWYEWDPAIQAYDPPYIKPPVGGWTPDNQILGVGKAVWIIPGGGLPLPSPPCIGDHPTSQTTECGGSATFSVTPMCADTNLIHYQWHGNAGPLSGETNSVLTVSPVGLSDVGFYWASLANDSGSITSFVASLTVVDTNAPIIVTCASNRTLVADTLCEAAVPDLTEEAVSIDTCEIVSLAQVPTPGTMIGLGDTVVMLTATDWAGNSSTCTPVITVVDLTPPDLACPADINTPCTDTNGAGVIFAPPAVSDACDASPQIVFTPPSGSILGEGVHAVDCLVTDASGNSTDCTFFVTVWDPVPAILAITQVVTDAEVSWPLSCTDFELEETRDLLSSTNWIPVSAPLQVVSGRYEKVRSMTNDHQVFRLRR